MNTQEIEKTARELPSKELDELLTRLSDYVHNRLNMNMQIAAETDPS